MDYCWLVVLICICIIDFVMDLVNCFDLLIVSYIFLDFAMYFVFGLYCRGGVYAYELGCALA